jgi:hypothetical protein
MTNFFVSNLGYILIDTSLYDKDNKVALASFLSTQTIASDKDRKDCKDCKDDEDRKDNSTEDHQNKDKTHKILVIENHNGKLLPDIFYDLKNHSNNVDFFLLTDDIHKDKDKKNELQYYHLFTKIFVNYYKPFFEQYSEFCNKYPERICWMPHCVPDSMRSNFNNNPLIKIGLLGHTAGKVYPNRAYLKELATYDTDLKDKIIEKAHASKKYNPVDYSNNTKLIGQTYFDTLNRFLCNFTCSLTLGYTVCKYFEIAYTGSLLLCDPTHDDLSQLGFLDMQTCIFYKSKEDIKEKILWILDPKNRHLVDEIRKAGMELVKKRHMVSIRCNEINNYLDFIDPSLAISFCVTNSS